MQNSNIYFRNYLHQSLTIWSQIGLIYTTPSHTGKLLPLGFRINVSFIGESEKGRTFSSEYTIYSQTITTP